MIKLYTKKARAVYKLSIFAFAIGSFMAYSMVTVVLAGFDPNKVRKKLIDKVSLISRFSLYVMNIKVDARLEALLKSNKNFLIVCNHLSYIDAFVISAFAPTCYVTSVEMKETPFLGQICQLAGCLFVERRSRNNLSGEVQEMSQALSEGVNVTVFPEAAAGNGEALLRFRRPLYQAAIDAKVGVLPLCLNYKTLDGEKVSLQNRDILFWHDDTNFFVHMLRYLESSELEISLDELGEIEFHEEHDKVALMEKSFALIESKYVKVN